MSDKNYEAIKKIMDNPELADEMEKTHPGIKAQMAGYLLSKWFPVGIKQRIIAVIIVLIIILGVAVYKNDLFYLLLFILPIFSPRIVGEMVNMFGKFFKNKGE
jgi:hypothetical protein